MVRTLALSLVALALILLVAAPAPADENKSDTFSDTTECIVVMVRANQLTVRKDDKMLTLVVAPDTRITCNGRPCKLGDLKPGIKVKATFTTKIEGTDREVNRVEVRVTRIQATTK